MKLCRSKLTVSIIEGKLNVKAKDTNFLTYKLGCKIELVLNIKLPLLTLFLSVSPSLFLSYSFPYFINN